MISSTLNGPIGGARSAVFRRDHLLTLQPGRMLSHYRLAEKIGEGGMGVVWKATDTTLDRSVAIKVLPDLFAADPERLARFDREARLLASLNHPNIAAIYGLHEADGVRFLAMELVTGEDLAQRLSRGALPLDEALVVARQAAEALEAAHEQGVIHRDLKPANIRITPEGKVKVLDFGLAKAFEAESASGNPSLSPTVTAAGTRAGVILGTAAYMSPEQARGRAVDRRADIWAFGCVLFEMLTGGQAFRGETVSDTLAAVLRAEPEWAELPDETPRRARDLLRRCLQKDPQQRLRDIGEARIVLANDPSGWAEEEAAAPMAPPTAPGKGRRTLRLGSLMALALMAGFTGWALRPAQPEPPLRKFELRVESGSQPVPLSCAPVISPDGKKVVYAADGRLWVRELDHLRARDLATVDKAVVLFWSPDSAWVAYLTADKLWKVPVTGGQSSVVCSLTGGVSSAGGGAWEQNGRMIFATGNSGLQAVSSQGGDAATLLEPGPGESDFHNVSPLPDDRGILFVVHRKQGYDTLALYAGKVRRDLLRMEGQRFWGPVSSPSGHILYHRDPTNPGIWAIPFSFSKLETVGEAFLVVPDGDAPSVSSDGTLAYLPEPVSRESQLIWVDRNGREVGVIGPPQLQGPFPRLSPDGHRVAVQLFEGGNQDIWIHDLVRNNRTRLTFSKENDILPVWSPAGDRVVFTTGTDLPDFTLHVKAADGTGEAQTLLKGISPDFSPDGKILVYSTQGDKTSSDIWYVRLEGDRKPVPFLKTAAREVFPQVSPDGSLLAYQSDESGRDEVYLKRFPGAEGKWQVSVNGGNWPRWGRRGDRLFYVEGQNLMEVTVSDRPSVTLGTPRRLFTRPTIDARLPFGWPAGYDVEADGERFLMTRDIGQGMSTARIAVVQNWFAEFKQKQ